LLRQGILTKAQLPILRAELEALGIVLDEQADHLPAFACSHAMMSDPGSFLFEYLATGKPLLPLINEEGEPLNEEASALIAECGSASNFESVKHFIATVVNGRIDSERYAALCKQHLPMLDGKAGWRVCAALIDEPQNIYKQIELHFPSNSSLEETSEITLVSAPEIAMCMPPVLKHLQAELRKIRHEKALESSFRKWGRARFNQFRTALGERIKHMPWLMERVRRMRSR
jgi:hypothetical protein